MENGRFAFLSSLWGPRDNVAYDVHLGLIGKRIVDFLLVLLNFFSLGVTAEAMQAKIDRNLAISLQRGHFDLKFQVQGVTSHQPLFLSEN